MGKRAQELAERFARANTEFSAFVERVPAELWEQAVSAGDPRSIGVLVRHVAWGYTYEQQYFQAIAERHPLPPVTEFATINAELAHQWGSLSKDDSLAALRAASEVVASWVRGLRDEQLATTGQYWVESPRWSVEQWIEGVLIGHIGEHLNDIRTTLEA
jgi:hypothetical protein